MNPIYDLKDEHKIIISHINKLQSYLNNPNFLEEIGETINKFGKIWDSHETKEESFFEWFEKQGGTFPFKKTLLEEHREIRGHWQVIQNFLNSKDKEKLMVALNTDGQMLINKFKAHIGTEERFFDNLFVENLGIFSKYKA